MSKEKEITMGDALQKLNGFLEDVRKEAAEEPNNTSHKDTADATPAAMSNDAPSNDSPEGSRVSKEKSQEAEAAGGTVATADDNTDEGVPSAAVPETNQDTQQMSADEPVTGSGQLGSIKRQEITQEQKVANLRRGIELVTKNIKSLLEEDGTPKEAADDYSAEDDKKDEKAAEKDGEKKKSDKKKGKSEMEDNGSVDKAMEKLQAALGERKSEEGGEEDLMATLDKWASDASAQVKQDMIAGALLRIQDEIALKEAMEMENFPKEAREAIDKIGGPSAFLDKVAMENPESIMAPEMDAAEEPVEEGGEEGAPVEGEGLEELTEEDIAELEQMLAEAGVTEEDLAASQSDLDAMAESGASPEEAAMAMDALTAEALGEDAEKVASELPERVKHCVEFLRARMESRQG